MTLMQDSRAPSSESSPFKLFLHFLHVRRYNTRSLEQGWPAARFKQAHQKYLDLKMHYVRSLIGNIQKCNHLALACPGPKLLC